VIHQNFLRLWLPSLAFALLVACIPGTRPSSHASDEAPVLDRQVDLIYTINNVGYTSTCG